MSENHSSSLLSTDGFRTPDGRRTFLPQSAWGWCEVVVVVLLGFYVIYFYTGLNHYSYHRPGRKALESTLRANLHQLRQAIDTFKADTGVYPAALTDLSAAGEPTVKAKIKPGSYKGPYLSVTGGIGDTGLPRNPFAVDAKGHDLSQGNPTFHWQYDPADGTVHPSVPKQGNTLDGIPYSEL